MKFKDLKEGMIIHWKADRMFKAWDTLGIVIKLTPNDVTILTFDDFKETTLEENGGEALKNEITPVSKEEALLKMQSKELELQQEILELEYRKTSIKRAISKIEISTCIV